MGPFASVNDVIARWRPLLDDESALAEVLIGDASDMIRVRWPDIDQRIESGQMSALTATRIVAGMVRRAMLNRDSEGVTQASETTGPFTGSQTYANPNNNLFLSAEDIRALDPSGFSPRVKIGWLA